MQKKGYFEIVKDDWTINFEQDVGEWLYILLGFILTMIVANFVGYIFNFIVKIVGQVFNASETFLGAFKGAPLEFIMFLILFSLVAIVFLLLGSKWKLRNVDVVSVLVSAFAVIFLTYVATSIYSELWKGKTSTEDKITEQKNANKYTTWIYL